MRPARLFPRDDTGTLDVSPDGTSLLAAAPAGANQAFGSSGATQVSTASSARPWWNPSTSWSPARCAFGITQRRKARVHEARRIGRRRFAGLTLDGGNAREILPVSGGLHAHWPAWSADGASSRHTSAASRPGTSRLPIIAARRAGSAESVTRRAVVPSTRGQRETAKAAGSYSANPASVNVSLWWKPLVTGRSG